MTTPNGDLTGVAEQDLPYQVAVYGSAARTADPITVADAGFAVPKGANAVHVYVSVTAKASSPSVVVNVEGFDKAGGTWYLLLASAALTDVATAQLSMWPGAATTSNVSANVMIPERIRVRPVHGNANALTYSVGVTFSRT